MTMHTEAFRTAGRVDIRRDWADEVRANNSE